jgi:ABC-2 type transport system permease protein
MNAATESKATVSWVHNFVWLVKRELWEHKALYVAPLIVAALVIAGTLLSLQSVGDVIAKLDGLDDKQRIAVRVVGYFVTATLFMLVMTVVTANYALDALYAERRDRSVLFWKSLPISDIETVLSKLAVAAVLVPLLAMSIALVTQLVMFTLIGFGAMYAGHGFSLPWQGISLIEMAAVLLYGAIVQALWYLPLWAYCLLASAWAPRAPFLWAVLPPVVLSLVEAVVFGTHQVRTVVMQRLNGVFPLSINSNQIEPASQSLVDFIDPGKLFMSPDLWIGLVIAGALIAATVWVRRYREAA